VNGPRVNIRDAVQSDWDFMRKAWRATFLLGGPAVQGADKRHYHDEMSRLFAAIVPTASARIACDPEDDDNPLGFACYEGPTLHYVYVIGEPTSFRRMGIVPLLLKGLPLKFFSFKTIQCEKRLKPAERGWLFRPSFTFSARPINGGSSS
jgi:hypothetical protein